MQLSRLESAEGHHLANGVTELIHSDTLDRLQIS